MKYLVIFLFTISVNFAISQEAKTVSKPKDSIIVKQNEIRLNAFSTILLSAFDVSYERLLSQDSSIGLSLLYNI